MHITRESIFISAIRTLCNTFAGVLGILLAIVAIFGVIFFLSAPTTLPKGTELSILPDVKGNHELLPESAPVILRINLSGIIGFDDLTSDRIEQILLDSRDGILKEDRVKAILLYCNTPGGTVTDSDNIYRALMNYKKKHSTPIYAYVDGECASGGVYISSAADKIYASPSSIIGSVGVLLGPVFNFSQMMDKIGVSSLTFTEGKEKDMLNPFRPWQPNEGHCFVAINQALYERFVHIVTTARPRLSKQKLIEEYGAQMYISSEAEKLGFIDVANADYNEALADLSKAIGVKEDESYQVIELSLPRSFFNELTQSQSPLLTGKLTHRLEIPNALPAEFSGRYLYLSERFVPSR